jgi:phytoene dehydrogenase-like protein
MPRSLAAASALLTRIGSGLALLTLNDYLNQNFRDPKLKGILASLWGAYGLPPSMSAFVIHAVVTNHYFGGGYYPIGGSKAIAESITPIVESEGGQILVNHEVKEIIIDGGKAIGVKVAHRQGGSTTEKQYFGKTIISDAGAYVTYKHLVPREVSLPFRNEFGAIPDGTSSVTLYLGLKDAPLNAGFRGENYWIYDSYDHEEMFSERNQLIDARVRACYVSFPSLKNPDAKSNTAEIIAFVDHHPFKRWADQPWRNRDREYESLKERISDALIDFTDSRI